MGTCFRCGAVLGVLLLIGGRGSADEVASENRPPTPGTPPFVVVTEGIVGGIVAPHVRLQLVVARDPATTKYKVAVLKQPTRDSPARYAQGVISKDQATALFEKLQNVGLYTLSVESPAGGEDVYGLDTSIEAWTGSKYWKNSGPGDCIHVPSRVKPSADERARFQKALTAIKALAEAQARGESDRASFQTVLSWTRGTSSGAAPDPCARPPTPRNFKITTRKSDDTVEVQPSRGKTVFVVTSLSGIGQADIEAVWPVAATKGVPARSGAEDCPEAHRWWR